MDDFLIFSKNKMMLDALMQYLLNRKENFVIADEGSIDKYLGVDIKKLDDDSYELRQPHLIQCVIDSFKLDSVENQKRATPVCKTLLHKDLKRKHRIKIWNFRSITGMPTYLQGSSRLHAFQWQYINVLGAPLHQCSVMRDLSPAFGDVFLTPKIEAGHARSTNLKNWNALLTLILLVVGPLTIH